MGKAIMGAVVSLDGFIADDRDDVRLLGPVVGGVPAILLTPIHRTS